MQLDRAILSLALLFFIFSVSLASASVTITNNAAYCKFDVYGDATLNTIKDEVNAQISSSPDLAIWRDPYDYDNWTDALSGSIYWEGKRKLDIYWGARNGTVNLDSVDKVTGDASIVLIPDDNVSRVELEMNTTNWYSYPSQVRYAMVIVYADKLNMSLKGSGWKLSEVWLYSDRYDTACKTDACNKMGALQINLSVQLDSNWKEIEIPLFGDNESDWNPSPFWLNNSVAYWATSNGWASKVQTNVTATDEPGQSGNAIYTGRYLYRLKLVFTNTTSTPGAIKLDKLFFWQRNRIRQDGNAFYIPCILELHDNFTCVNEAMHVKASIYNYASIYIDDTANAVFGKFTENKNTPDKGCTLYFRAPSKIIIYYHTVMRIYGHVEFNNFKLTSEKLRNYMIPTYQVLSGSDSQITMRNCMFYRGAERAVSVSSQNTYIKRITLSDFYKSGLVIGWSVWNSTLEDINIWQNDPELDAYPLEIIAGNHTLMGLDISSRHVGYAMRLMYNPTYLKLFDVKLPEGRTLNDMIYFNSYYLGISGSWDIVERWIKTTFSVKDKDGNPIPNANITVFSSGTNELLAQGTTDSNGELTLEYPLEVVEFTPDVWSEVTQEIPPAAAGTTIQVFVANSSIYHVGDKVAISSRNASFYGDLTTYYRRLYSKIPRGTVAAVGPNYINVTLKNTVQYGVKLIDLPTAAIVGNATHDYSYFVTRKHIDHRPIIVKVSAYPYDDYQLEFEEGTVPVTMKITLRKFKSMTVEDKEATYLGLFIIAFTLFIMIYRIGKRRGKNERRWKFTRKKEDDYIRLPSDRTVI